MAAEFIPYIYGAAHGRPSAGRPEKVLGHLKTENEIQQEGRVADSLNGRVTPRGALPRSPRNGMPKGEFYEYQGDGRSLSEGEAAALLTGRTPVPPRRNPVRKAPEIARCPDCKQPKPDHLRICPQAPVFVPEAIPAAPEPKPLAVTDGRRGPKRKARLTTRCPGCGRPKPDSYATCGGSGPCRVPTQAPVAAPAPVAESEPEVTPAPVPEVAAPAVTAPGRRCRQCHYVKDSSSCLIMCGGGS